MPTSTLSELSEIKPAVMCITGTHLTTDSTVIDNLILYNINGLYPRCNQTKVPFMEELCEEQKPKLVCIIETHLTSEISDTELKIQNYNLFRADRKTRTRGGVAIYCVDTLNCTTLLSTSNSVCELLIIKIDNSIICLLYRPPDCVYEELKTMIDQARKILSDHKQCDIIFLGDFNFPEIQWSDPSSPVYRTSTKDRKQQIDLVTTLTEDLYLNQLITAPTRENNTLDLVFSNITDSLYDFNATKSELSDHMLLEVKLTPPQTPVSNTNPKPPVVKNRLNYYKADFNSIKQELKDINWKPILDGKSVTHQYESFLEAVDKVARKHTPEVKPHTTSYRSKFYKERRALMRKRRRVITAINKCINLTHKTNLQSKLSDIESDITSSHCAEKTHDETEAIKKIASNSKYFFTYARKKQKTKEKVGPFIDKSTSEIISDEKQIADRLQTQFCSVFSKSDQSSKIPDAKSFFNDPAISNLNSIGDVEFTTSDIQKAIKELKSSSAPGLDGFSALLLKECAEELSDPLYTIFRHSLDSGEVPSILKDAIIVPIHKGGLKSQPQNYRPINLISHILKVLEKIIRYSIVKFLEDNNLMNPNQHGFRPQRSCLSQLLEHFDTVLEAIYNDKCCDVIYLDFSKAFDVVDHNILMRKLKKLGITGKLGFWINSFLSNRQQTVSVNSTKSDTKPVTSGVPQGSVLGPVLFLIMISDIDEDLLHGVASVFADDTKLKHFIESMTDCENLQSDLNRIYEWGETNNMKFNHLKFQSIKYGKNVQNYAYQTPAGEPIQLDEHVKDLGVIMSKDLSFTKHIDKVTARCRSLIGWILRTFDSRTKVLMLTLFKSLILPRLDYCSQLYSPTLIQDWCKLESIQRRFTSHILDEKEYDYWTRLQHLKLYSIHRRQERYAIIYTWKIINNLAPNLKTNPITTHFSDRRGLYCNVPTLRNARSSKTATLRDGSFAIRGPKLYNVLPQSIRNLQNITVDAFKNALDKVLCTLPDEPTVPGYAGGRATKTNSLLDVLPAYNNSNMMISGGHTCRP